MEIEKKINRLADEWTNNPIAEVGSRSTLRFVGFEISLDAPEHVQCKLESYLSPYVSFQRCNRIRTSIYVRATANPKKVEIVKEEFKRLPSHEQRLHGNICGLLLITPGKSEHVWNVGNNIVYEIQKSGRQRRLDFICNTFTTNVCLDLVRILRGILSRGVELQHALRIHAACVSKDRRAIAFVGPSETGKTSFMLASLRSGWADGFITNDKALVVSSGGTTDIIGIPYAVSIGDGALKKCPTLNCRNDGRHINGETYFWPMQLAESFNCRLESQGSLAAILQVQIDLTSKKETIESLDIQTCLGVLTEFTDSMHPKWLHRSLALNKKESLEVFGFGNVPCCRITGNPWNMDFTKVIRGVLIG